MVTGFFLCKTLRPKYVKSKFQCDSITIFTDILTIPLMINVYIYLESKKNAEILVRKLMEVRLIAHATIDKDNHSFILLNNKITEQSHYVITAQSKAILFTEIVDYVNSHGGENIRIYSLPITQCNEIFSEIIRENTKPGN